MASSGPSPQMPACRMPNDDYTVQIERVCFGQHAQVINGIGDILKCAWSIHRLGYQFGDIRYSTLLYRGSSELRKVRPCSGGPQ